MHSTSFQERLLERFVTYAAIGTQSSSASAEAGVFPSTDNQKAFARTLAEELENIGAENVHLDDFYYVHAVIPASAGKEHLPSFGLCAHMDTASDAPGDNVKPLVHRGWNGAPILLHNGFSIDPASDRDLAGCIGDTIITSDGTTLLGADDKAGIAGIMTLAEVLLSNKEIQHGTIEILFSPDEETGHGMDRIDLSKLKSKAFYTVDGGQLGEVESECFNAWRADIVFTGKAAHLGSARGKMINALTMASNFISDLPSAEAPETTDGYGGYFCPLELHGGAEKAELTVYLRDFSAEGMENRLKRIEVFAKAAEARYPGSTVSVKTLCQYKNMKEKLDQNPRILELLNSAVERAGVTPVHKPIRGGTDGSRLTEMGIPTPNIFTGGHNYHSRTEWASLSQMTAMVNTLIELAKLWGE